MENIIKQLDELITEFDNLQDNSGLKDLSDLSKMHRQALITRAVAAIGRISGKHSTYSIDVERIFKQHPLLHRHTSSIMGIVLALRDDVKAGYITTLIELTHAELFSDYLDMAYHLQQSKYKDAAAIITGSTLESHLRKLSIKHEINIEKKGVPVKADKLNSDLAKAIAYSKMDQKSVTAWLGLRNSAAHGKYDEYTSDQVDLFISSVRDFIGRLPA